MPDPIARSQGPCMEIRIYLCAAPPFIAIPLPGLGAITLGGP